MNGTRIAKLIIGLVIFLSCSLLPYSCCSTTAGDLSIPPLTLERPERPYLEGTYEEMLRATMGYAMELEQYADRLELYIASLDDILSVDDSKD